MASVLVGALLPVLIQLFSTLRTLQRAAGRIDDRLESLIDRVGRPSASAETGSMIASALTTAIVTGVQAFRANREAAAESSASSSGQAEGAATK